MGIFELLVVFVIAWWIVFLAVLPIGVRGQFEDGAVVPGSESGAPSEPMVRKKAIWATAGAAILTAVCFAAYTVFLASV
ncbi:MAG: DUF1467 family protein [Pseudomonadota bacterium]